MVPLADLFNHKTAAENVHFTSVSSSSESDSDTGNGNDGEINEDSEPDSNSETEASPETSSPLENELTFMEMVIVKGVKAGDEVYNTYGYVGNAALLHRYGFTELGNPFDILNIDLDIVVEWSCSFLSSRSIRGRVSGWRKFGYSGFISQGSEYFEISFDGEPQMELLILLYILLLPTKEFHKLDLTLSVRGNTSLTPSRKESFLSMIYSEPSKKLLLTQRVGRALVSLADARERLYGLGSLEEDGRLLDKCSVDHDPKMYHSLVLRIGERTIIGKLRCFGGVLKNDDGGGRRYRKKL